ncbi:Phosphofructokinase [Planctomycetales bacterium 10988]|nr:Phosphofructokinase [Planctomycetales bacterium 10988]
MILAFGLSPAWQQIYAVDDFEKETVNRALQRLECASGKVLNVGVALTFLQAEARTLSVGGGLYAQAIQEELQSLKVDYTWVPCETPTRICTTILNQLNSSESETPPWATTELVENALSLPGQTLLDFEQAFENELATASLLIGTGSLPQGVRDSYYYELFSKCSIPFICDFRGTPLRECLPLRPLLVKPNREELALTFDTDLSEEEALRDAIGQLLREGARHVLITDGGQPAWAATAKKLWRIPPLEISPINTIGCGDCLTAGFAWAWQQGWPWERALQIGIAAAAANAKSLLPARLDPDQICKDAEAVQLIEEKNW